jgi:hypothetical protein
MTTEEGNTMSGNLEFTLKTVPSTLRVTGGREIPFAKAILSLHNAGDSTATGVVAHATLSEERGMVHDATEALKRATPAESIPPGGELTWDLYELLLAAHPGVASKVHLWGYKAALNWWIDLSTWAEYREQSAASPMRTAISRWKLRWIPAGPSGEKIDLALEAVESR